MNYGSEPKGWEPHLVSFGSEPES